MKRILILITVLGFTLAGCGGDSATESFNEVGQSLQSGGDGATEPASDRDEAGPDSGFVDLDIALADSRKVIRNASLRLAANDTRATYDEIVAITEDLGGFVENAEVSPTDDDNQPGIALTVRVPSEQLSGALNAFKATAEKVISESQGAQDVTETYIDLEAQLTNLSALEVELRALLEEVRKQPDSDPDKLLRVFTEISNTRGQIERIQGQLNYLDDAVGLSTVSVNIAPTPQAVPIVDDGWTPTETVRDATRTLVAGLQNLGDATITFAIAVLPLLLLLLGLPGLVLYVAFRWWRHRRGHSPIAPQVPAEQA